jgi:hypothetical protein
MREREEKLNWREARLDFYGMRRRLISRRLGSAEVGFWAP